MMRALLKDEQGATVLEFAFILLPMCVLLIGGLDLGYQSYARTMMQAALNDAARRATVENPQFSASGETTEAKIEAMIGEMVGHIAVDAEINVTRQSYFEFSDVGNSEKLMTDHNDNGEYDEEDGDCWEDANYNGQYDVDAGITGGGNANDVVFYSAAIAMPRLFPTDAFLPLPDTIEMTLETAVRNQPYGNQGAPVIVCGEED